MAKIKWSAIGITNASGKSGGSVFAHNRGGSYVRRWAKPVNRQSSAQTVMRSIFSAVTKAWGGLTQGEVSAWEQFGLENPKTDVFGDSRPQSGFNAFVGVNQNRLHAGFSGIIKMPLPKTLMPGIAEQYLDIQVDTPAGVENHFNMQLYFDRAVTLQENIVLSIGFAVVNEHQNRGFGSVKNKFTNRVRIPINTLQVGIKNTFGINEATDPQIKEMIDSLQTGEKVFTQIHLHSADGQKSNEVTNMAVVTEFDE